MNFARKYFRAELRTSTVQEAPSFQGDLRTSLIYDTPYRFLPSKRKSPKCHIRFTSLLATSQDQVLRPAAKQYPSGSGITAGRQCRPNRSGQLRASARLKMMRSDTGSGGPQLMDRTRRRGHVILVPSLERESLIFLRV